MFAVLNDSQVGVGIMRYTKRIDNRIDDRISIGEIIELVGK